MESTPIDPAMGAGPEAEDATNGGQREKSNLSDKLTYVGVNGECFNTILLLFVLLLWDLGCVNAFFQA